MWGNIIADTATLISKSLYFIVHLSVDLQDKSLGVLFFGRFFSHDVKLHKWNKTNVCCFWDFYFSNILSLWKLLWKIRELCVTLILPNLFFQIMSWIVCFAIDIGSSREMTINGIF